MFHLDEDPSLMKFKVVQSSKKVVRLDVLVQSLHFIDVIRSFDLILTRNNGTESKVCARGTKK